ncbi:MAG: HD domain-containing protein [Chloroflexi bacterium]|nr:HD domain-containing protein [Chloroflexota bacterium]
MRADQEGVSKVRLAEVIAALSLATDLGMGQPMEHALRRCLLAVRLGEALGLSDRELGDAYYVALVCSVGCTIKLQEYVPWFRDEIAAAEQAATLDPTMLFDDAMFVLGHVGQGEPPLQRATKVITALASGQREMHRSSVACNEICRTFGEMLELGPGVQQALGQMHERWDGRGEPFRLRGEEKALAARIAHLAGDAILFHRLGGIEAAVDVVQRRAAKTYDPRVARRFCENAPQLLEGVESETLWDSVLAAEPVPQRWVDEEHLDTLAKAMAHFADSKSPYTINHSAGVAALAGAAARRLAMAEADVSAVRRAGFLHDLGRIGVPVGIWDKPGPLTPAEWERVRMHPYLTERILARSGALVHLGALAALHHERLDGSGYHRGVSASFLPMAARVLAAADFFHAKTEPRPHRPALTPETAAEAMRQEAHAGRLDTEAANAVLGAVGQKEVRQRGSFPAGLSEREVEVLRLLARGCSVRDVAEVLSVSPRTVAHHVQHIYGKIGVSSRAAVTLFAVRHDLIIDTAA